MMIDVVGAELNYKVAVFQSEFIKQKEDLIQYAKDRGWTYIPKYDCFISREIIKLITTVDELSYENIERHIHDWELGALLSELPKHQHCIELRF